MKLAPRITGKIEFTCSNCDKKYSFEHINLNFQTESMSKIGMGEETRYVSEYVQQCDACDQKISIKLEVWEYPVGIINRTTSSSNSAHNISSSFSFIHSQDDESNRLVGTAAGGAILGASIGGPWGAFVGGIIGGLLGDSVNKSKRA